MNKESSNKLIGIIKDYLHDDKTNVSIDDDLLKLTDRHQLEALVYKQTKDQRLKKANAQILYAYQKRLLSINKINNLLVENNIPFFYVKGLEIAKYYKDPYIKTMGDSDITVHLKDKKKVADLLLNNGFIEDKDDNLSNEEWHFYKDDILFELHHALLYEEDANKKEYLDYFSNCWDYVNDNKLDDSYHLLYLFIHLRKHFVNKGVGIRQFLDIAEFSKADINWKWLEEELNKLGLIDFAHSVYGLIAAWWDFKYPLAIKYDKDFIEESTAVIMDAGVFGFDNGKSRMINKELKNGDSLFLFKLRCLFPSYEMMLKDPRYAGLKGKPYLLPAFWLYRASISGKYIKTKLIPGLTMKQKDIDDRTKLYKQWGLWQ